MKNFSRILSLIRKTGDRYIFEDEQGSIFVVMGADDYENFIFDKNSVKDFSEEELLNKINKDIAIWKASQEKDNYIDLVDIPDHKEEEEEDRYYFEPVEDEE